MGSQSSQLRIGIIGAGVVARRHAQAFTANPHAQVVAVAEISREKGEAFAAEYGAEFFLDYHDLMHTANVDAVSVCTPHDLHCDIALAAANASVHMLMEKPISISLDEADRMLDACTKADVKMMMGFVHRFREEHLTARRLIAEGAIGSPMHLHDNICTYGGEHPPAWVWRHEHAGGGVLMYGGIHGVDRLLWLLDDDVREVYARKLLYSNGGNADVEDGLSAILTFNKGAIGNLFENSPAYGNPGGWLTELYGTSGAVRVKNADWLELTQSGKTERLTFSPYDHFQREIDEFVAAIREGRDPWITGEDGRRSIAVVQAIYQSAMRGEPVSIY